MSTPAARFLDRLFPPSQDIITEAHKSELIRIGTMIRDVLKASPAKLRNPTPAQKVEIEDVMTKLRGEFLSFVTYEMNGVAHLIPSSHCD